MKNFSSLLDKCRTAHAFEPNSVKEEVLREALEDSLKAPNHKLTFPWKYLWVRGQVKEAMAELAVEIKSKGEKLPPEKERGIKKKVLSPELVVFCQQRNENGFRAKEDYATLCCSVQLFALSLAEKDIGYKWSTGKMTRHLKTYEILGIEEDKFEIIGFIFAGRALKKPKKRSRPPLSQVLTLREEL